MENPIQAEQQVGSKFVQPRSEQLLALLHWASMLICDGATEQPGQFICYFWHAHRGWPGQVIGALRSHVRIVEKDGESGICDIACVDEVDQSIARCSAPCVIGNWSASPRQDVNETRRSQNRKAYVAGRKMRL